MEFRGLGFGDGLGIRSFGFGVCWAVYGLVSGSISGAGSLGAGSFGAETPMVPFVIRLGLRVWGSGFWV